MYTHTQQHAHATATRVIRNPLLCIFWVEPKAERRQRLGPIMSLPGLRSVSRPAAAPASSSKQKSCNACVRSKRRCDKRTPRCSRCVSKGMLCVYGGRADLRGDRPPPLDLAALSAPVTGAPDLECFDIGVSLGSALGLSPLQFDIDLGGRLGNSMPAVPSPSRSTLWQHSFLEQNAETAAAAEVALTMRDYSRMAHICVCWRVSYTDYLSANRVSQDEFRKFLPIPSARDMRDL
jgi:hypothetical protein